MNRLTTNLLHSALIRALALGVLVAAGPSACKPSGSSGNSTPAPDAVQQAPNHIASDSTAPPTTAGTAASHESKPPPPGGPSSTSTEEATISPAAKVGGMTVTSPAFAAGQPIPPRYTCEAGDLSPPLQWSQGPTGTKRYVIVMEDLDSKDGVWDHWVIWNLRGTSLPEGQSPSPLLPGAVCQGVNSWGQTGYRGPCPPIGEPPHRYRITVFAVNQPLGAPFDSTRNEVVQLIQPFVLSKGELEFTCQRKSGQ